MSAWRQSPIVLTVLCASGAIGGCNHSWPFDAWNPAPLGPRGQEVPRRLTFNPGDDRDQNVRGGSIAFSRLDPDERGKERCLATIPLAGGTISAETCPGPPATPADTFVDTWIRPSLAPAPTRRSSRSRSRSSAICLWRSPQRRTRQSSGSFLEIRCRTRSWLDRASGR